MLTKTDSIAVGSSQMGAALGLDPGCSRAKLYRRLTGTQTPAELKPNPLLESFWEMGNANEHLCVSAIEIASGVLFDHTGDDQITTHKGRVRSTPDGLANMSACEAKCVSAYGKWDYPKPVHIAQCMTHIYANDLEKCYFGRWKLDEDTMVWVIEKNDEYVDWMLRILDDFLECLDNLSPPETFVTRPVSPEVYVERIH